MIILGLNGDATNPAACVLRDGQLVAFIEEERLTRLKSSHGLFPSHSAKACLQMAGIRSLDQVDAIAWGWDAHKYPLRMLGFFARAYLAHPVRAPFRAGQATGQGGIGEVLRELMDKRPARRLQRIREQLRHVGLPGRIPPVHFINHHLCHAASAYYLSGFDEAAILVLDGSGEETCTSISQARSDSITRRESLTMPHSLGWFYAAFTELLGFTPYGDEGKLMGLAAYGRPDPRMQAMVETVLRDEGGGLYRVEPRYTLLGNHYLGTHFSDELAELTGLHRPPGAPITQAHRDLAYAVQEKLEEVGVALAMRAMQLTGSRKLCLAGGVALNCKMNGAIAQRSGCESLFVQPAANDAGAALGAALVVARQLGRLVRSRLKHTQYGPAFSNDEIRATLDLCGAEYSMPDDIACAAAELVAQGQVVGWFQGGMEFGARALGGRSILANPADPTMSDRVNGRVKFREPWRPFCPSMSEAFAREWLDGAQHAEFMAVAYPALPGWQQRLPAVVHVDGSVRPQVVDPQVQPLYHAYIAALANHTGHAATLNTSLNVRAEPVVATPLDALRCFTGTGMDALAIGDLLLTKRGAA